MTSSPQKRARLLTKVYKQLEAPGPGLEATDPCTLTMPTQAWIIPQDDISLIGMYPHHNQG
jgi:hypothetical protein